MSPKSETAAEQAVAIDPLSPERVAKVDAARQTWIRQLVDLSRRNNLLYFRELKVGTLDLTDAPAKAMLALLQSGKPDAVGVSLSELIPADRRAKAVASLNEIGARARSNFEERGLDTLFVALGLASWTAPDGGRNAAAPVLLIPIQASQTSGRNGVWTLKRTGDVKVNDVLVHALREEHGIQLDSDALVTQVMGDDDGELFDLEPVFAAVAGQAAQAPAFTIERRWIAGNFAFQKMAIVKDLQQLAAALARHDIVAGIAGDRGAADHARGDRSAVDAAEFDRQQPSEEFLIRDADSSQQQAIAATLRGQNGVISGPPGTGKSQTISNLIAEMVARGKTVLFVAEKRAALDVVLNRLKEADLGHLCLDCHGAELTRRHVAEQLQASIERVREAPVPDAEVLHRTFVERRNRLNAHVRGLHQVRQPGGLSVYALYGRILRQRTGANSTTRLPAKVLEALDERTVGDCMHSVRELTSLSGLVTRTADSPWVGAAITSPEQLRGVIERARRLANERWPEFESAMGLLLAECPVIPPVSVALANGLFDTLLAIQGTLSTCDKSLFRADLFQLARALAPAKSPLGAIWATLFSQQDRLGPQRLGHRRTEMRPRRPPLRQAAAERLEFTRDSTRDACRSGGHQPVLHVGAHRLTVSRGRRRFHPRLPKAHSASERWWRALKRALGMKSSDTWAS